MEGATAENGSAGENGGSPGLPDGVNQFAVTKLEECGFHRTRDDEAVQSTARLSYHS